uniref:Glycosyltransferase n=1 Tax=candidate division WOR-3 bacterium TaxID=2052148 RepID=A0A7C6A9I9_UNCW3
MKIFSFVFVDLLRIMIFLLVQVLIAITNAFLIKRLGKFPKAKRQPKISILVPARNEEKTIKNCINSLLQQNYDNFEVIVLDDNSIDQTKEILKNIQSRHLRIIEGKPLPANWTGKSWACQQLASEASGELIFFTDADTIHHPSTIAYAVDAMEANKVDLLTAIVRNEVVTFGEMITIPFPTYSIFTFLPLVVAYTLPKSTAFSAANGKFMFFRKKVYEQIGGHAAIRNNAVEDIELGKLIKKNGYRWRLVDASRLVYCRMYQNFSEALQGFTKNYFALFGYQLLVALFVWLWLALITWYPLVAITIHIIANRYNDQFCYAVGSIIATSFLWLLTSLKFSFPIYLFLLYPVIITITLFIGLRSMTMTILGRTIWKGRQLPKKKIRLI